MTLENFKNWVKYLDGKKTIIFTFLTAIYLTLKVTDIIYVTPTLNHVILIWLGAGDVYGIRDALRKIEKK